MSFGDWLKTNRIQSGLSQKRLVEAAERLAGREVCTDGYVSNLERNYDVGKKRQHTRPDIFIVDSLAAALAEALNRPREELTAEARVAAGYAPPQEETVQEGFAESDFARLHRIYGQLSEGMQVKFRPVLEMVSRELYHLAGEERGQARAGGKRGHTVRAQVGSEKVDEPDSRTIRKKSRR